MPAPLIPFFEKELCDASIAFNKSYFKESWRHLERAHILGQPYPVAHSIVHWKMLCFGIKTKNPGEVAGQIPRLIVGGIKSFVGKIPTGNSGGSNVPALQAMEIPEDLMEIIEKTKTRKETPA